MPSPLPPAPARPDFRDGRLLAWGIPALSLVIAWFQQPAGLVWHWRQWAAHWLISLYFTTGYWLSVRALWYWLLRRLPQPAQTVRRLWATVPLAVLVTSGTTVLLMLPLHWLLPQWFPFTGQTLAATAVFSLVPTVAVLSFYESFYFFQQWQASLRRADQLVQASTQAQLDALAQQLDPHFLFNSLNTLAALIEPANAPAQHYVEGLADVYRYVLLSRERPTVPLAEELAFVETYVALQKVRFRDNVQVSYHIAPAALVRRVAPLSVQVLVENALKHNEASQARPLHLRLEATADALRVENTYQPRPAGLAPGTGTGLANVRQRYALLGAMQPVEATQAAGLFTVTLPLLDA
ncbi:MAG: sensor histidine kinase [Janthinobacterium lividum]